MDADWRGKVAKRVRLKGARLINNKRAFFESVSVVVVAYISNLTEMANFELQTKQSKDWQLNCIPRRALCFERAGETGPAERTRLSPETADLRFQSLARWPPRRAGSAGAGCQIHNRRRAAC